MKVLVYFENLNSIKKSGIGRAERHQREALSFQGIEYTNDPKDSYDVAHINTYWWKSHRALRKAKKKGIPVIVHGHSTFEDFKNSFRLWKVVEPLFDRQLKYMYSRADMIIAPTNYAKSLIKGYGFCQNVIAVSNGLDLSDYQDDPEAVRLFREKFGLAPDEKFVMGVGFPFERKGLIDFIEVARRFPDTKFLWFGGLQRILTSRKILKAIEGKPHNVIMAGYTDGRLIRGAYQSASCMFFPTYEETEGIVVLEALGSHCPLLVRDIGVYEDWLTDGIDCHKGKTNDEFERTIRDLLENGERKEILEAGYLVASERTLERVSNELKDAYESLLK